MKGLLILMSFIALSVYAGEGNSSQQEILLKNGSKKIDLGLVRTVGHPDSVLNYSFILVRDKNSSKKITFKYQMNMIVKKCVDYDVEIVEQPAFTEKVCEAVGNGDYQCENKTFDQLYVAKPVCIQKGWAQQTVSKKIKVTFKKAAALSRGSVEKFVISLKQKKYSSDNVELMGDVVSSPVRYKVSTGFLSDSISFKVLH